eukprot:CAMPEP_0184310788 /NCGR_PEP_ID=MMETSP1049-20130417/34599_1 /TAXON_ID=77928 /ORGANISM="Proteomonas sulcata, Strain CCMP704" /LENGTH=396 /DNA_ID=CAMNT_0026625439 /DNA_START=50 /DNA_END=1240 /DNA_ORIENTATION=-
MSFWWGAEEPGTQGSEVDPGPEESEGPNAQWKNAADGLKFVEEEPSHPQNHANLLKSLRASVVEELRAAEEEGLQQQQEHQLTLNLRTAEQNRYQNQWLKVRSHEIVRKNRTPRCVSFGGLEKRGELEARAVRIHISKRQNPPSGSSLKKVSAVQVVQRQPSPKATDRQFATWVNLEISNREAEEQADQDENQLTSWFSQILGGLTGNESNQVSNHYSSQFGVSQERRSSEPPASPEQQALDANRVRRSSEPQTIPNSQHHRSLSPRAAQPATPASPAASQALSSNPSSPSISSGVFSPRISPMKVGGGHRSPSISASPRSQSPKETFSPRRIDNPSTIVGFGAFEKPNRTLVQLSPLASASPQPLPQSRLWISEPPAPQELQYPDLPRGVRSWNF